MCTLQLMKFNEVSTYGNIFKNKDDWTVNLSNEWENKRVNVVLHEMLHALGFYHEHSRKDRDHFVDVSEKSKLDKNYWLN